MSRETRSVTDGLPIVNELEQYNILQASAAAPTSSAAPKTKVMHPVVAWLQKHFSREVVTPTPTPTDNASSDILDGLTAALHAIQSKMPAANSHQIEPTKVLQFSAPSTSAIGTPSPMPINALEPSPTDLKPKNRK